jgi:hypothetical protein
MKSKKHTAACSASRYPAGRGHQKSPDALLRQARCDSSLKSIAFAAALGTLTRLRDLGPLIATVGFTALLVGGVLWAFWDTTGRPTVYQSYLTRECMRVEFVDGSPGDCSDLPDRYRLVWVE